MDKQTEFRSFLNKVRAMMETHPGFLDMGEQIMELLKDSPLDMETVVRLTSPGVDDLPREADPAILAVAEGLLAQLESAITDGMKLPEILNAFEAMCRLPAPEDDILFETGTFEKQFYFHLTRQFSNGADEYYQLHVDVQYRSCQENRCLEETTWSCADENIFDHIRSSAAYRWAEREAYVGLEIYLEET